MKQSSKIALSLGIVTSLLTISQVSSAARANYSFDWRKAAGHEKIIFDKSTDPACASATPNTVDFFYHLNSDGKDMTLVKPTVFKKMIQISRKAGKGENDFTYQDSLTPSNHNYTTLFLNGTVKSVGKAEITNEGSWQRTVGDTICNGRYYITDSKGLPK